VSSPRQVMWNTKEKRLFISKGRYSLLTDSGLLDEALAKDLSLVTPLEAFFDDGPGLSDDGARHHEALVVKV
jgi:hypothetical protein